MAQTAASQEQKPSIEELLRRLDALQARATEGDKLISALRHRVDELETRDKHSKLQATTARREAAAPTAGQKPSPIPATSTEPRMTANAAVLLQPAGAAIPGLRPPEPMGSQYDGEGQDALRSDLPGLSLLIPGSQSEVRFYGFANLHGYHDFNGRNQSDAPTVQTIPLSGSPADLQGGDTGLSARFSRIGMDTRTAIAWGTLETRLEGDFGGGAAASPNAVFRLRQAWGELGTEQFRVLVGWANSLWNEGVYETVNFSTNLNQSFVRQPQVRATATLAPGLTGHVSIEMPDTQYTSAAGVFTQISTPAGFGGLSPAFASVPDLLGRLEYRNDGLGLDLRGLLRDLTIRTAGTSAAPPAVERNTAGWGFAGSGRFPMRWLSPAFGPDELVGMAYYGQGIGRYFGANTFGQDALSNIGLPGVVDPSLDALPTYGASAGYRHFWTPQVRSNFVYSYAWQQYPSYAQLFVPGSASATSLNSTMQQGIVNLIWSPFAELRGNSVGTGWLDVGLEYVYSHRDVYGGTAATAPVSTGSGTANRILGSATVRF
ncbi:DcaP family trimeric outer membrane transporter [Bradyrhizobium sp. McL0616]|uniref:DcaP family trimeric outer membrane transporter n=1 Tax=Bradyrhizobium sp. McL0616 TaxID=3415674 RepID=UPI003CF68762